MTGVGYNIVVTGFVLVLKVVREEGEGKLLIGFKRSWTCYAKSRVKGGPHRVESVK